MADYLLGLDYGTGGAKACIIDGEGNVLGFAFMEYPFYHDHPGWSEHDPAYYWTVACQMIHECMAQARIGAAEIRGVAVSSALPSMVMVDREHRPINRAYNLMDRRAQEGGRLAQGAYRRRAHPAADGQPHRGSPLAGQPALGEEQPTG